MNDFLARNSNIQPSRTVGRTGKAILRSQASKQTGNGSDGNAAAKSVIVSDEAEVEQKLSSAAEVAEAQAKVAALLSELQNGASVDINAVEAQIAAILPRPTVIVPLPPANRDAVERAVHIAESIRASATVAKSTQANLGNGVAEGILA